MTKKKMPELTNERLEEAILEYQKDRTAEKLTPLVYLLRTSDLYVPAELMEPDKPMPCFLKNKKGDAYMPVYTTKQHVPKDPIIQGLLCMSFWDCTSIAMNEALELFGMVINPFTSNVVLTRKLIAAIQEQEKEIPKIKKVELTPEQFDIFVKEQVEFYIMPALLFHDSENFVERLCDEREEFINEIFRDAYKDPKMYRGSQKDFAVMALNIAEDLTLIRVDLPERRLIPPLCYRLYVTFNPLTKEAGFYTIEKTQKKNVRILGQVIEGGSHLNYGFAPAEGRELKRIIDLVRGDEKPVAESVMKGGEI